MRCCLLGWRARDRQTALKYDLLINSFDGLSDLPGCLLILLIH
jgi:hypothetical protein